VGKMSAFESAWALLKAGGWEERGGVGYGQTGKNLDMDFPDPESQQEQLQHASPLGDMRVARQDPNSALANMSIEEAHEFNRQMAAKPRALTQQSLEDYKQLRQQKELGLEPEGPTEPEDDYPFPQVRRGTRMVDYRQPRREPINIP
tara:strand:+ start:1159 stop:1599 length:441 start_codon:yes stop_codon:yes gene_type:complete